MYMTVGRKTRRTRRSHSQRQIARGRLTILILLGAVGTTLLTGCGSHAKRTRITIPALIQQLEERNPSFKRPGRTLKCRYGAPGAPDDAICDLVSHGQRLVEFTVKIKDGKVVDVIGVPT
jgi:hypothetical protein